MFAKGLAAHTRWADVTDSDESRAGWGAQVPPPVANPDDSYVEAPLDVVDGTRQGLRPSLEGTDLGPGPSDFSSVLAGSQDAGVDAAQNVRRAQAAGHAFRDVRAKTAGGVRAQPRPARTACRDVARDAQLAAAFLGSGDCSRGGGTALGELPQRRGGGGIYGRATPASRGAAAGAPPKACGASPKAGGASPQASGPRPSRKRPLQPDAAKEAQPRSPEKKQDHGRGASPESPAEEVDWERRLVSRMKSVAAGKSSPEYRWLQELRRRGDGQACAQPQTPDATDQSLRKRRWKSELHVWRAALKQVYQDTCPNRSADGYGDDEDGTAELADP